MKGQLRRSDVPGKTGHENVTMQVNCSACGGSLKLTDQWRETGILRCPYCDAENLLPEEVLAPHDQRPEKPKDSNIRHIREINRLEFHIGPRGKTEVSKLMLTGLALGCVFCAGAFLGGLYVNRLLWIAAGTSASSSGERGGKRSKGSCMRISVTSGSGLPMR